MSKGALFHYNIPVNMVLAIQGPNTTSEVIKRYITVYSGNSKRLNSEHSLISEHFW